MGVDIIFLSFISKKKEVLTFLRELKFILEKTDFDIDTDIVLIRKKKKEGDEKFSTPFTLLDLNYDMADVVRCLKKLELFEYSETKVDKNDVKPPLLYVFGKKINDKLVYVKLKIKGTQHRHILCVSFHYAKENMEFPYKDE